MPTKISRELIAKKILHGIEKAQKDYEVLSYGDWLCYAPEYLLTTYITRSIAAIKCKKYIVLENSTRCAIDYAGALTRGRIPEKARANGRIDILLFWGTKYSGDSIYPRAVIEVKHNVYSYAQCKGDINRIRSIVLKNYNNNTLQFGALAFYISREGKRKTASEKIQSILDKIKSEATNELSKSFHVRLFSKYSKLHKNKDGDSAWAAACLMLIPKEVG